MCVAALGIVAGLVGTAVSAAGAIQQGNAASAQAEYTQMVSNNNAVLAERAAEDARKRGEIAEDEHRRKTSALQSRQRTVMAANGLDVSSGSPLDILADTAQMGELDALTIRGNARRESLGYEAQGMNFKAEGELARARGESAKTAGMIGAAGAVVSGVGGVADKWYRMDSGVGRIS